MLSVLCREGEKLRVLPCRHRFHMVRCLQRCLSKRIHSACWSIRCLHQSFDHAPPYVAWPALLRGPLLRAIYIYQYTDMAHAGVH